VEAIYLVCGARRPQLKRNPLGGMTQHGTKAPEDRALSAPESHLLGWLLDHGKPAAQQYLGQAVAIRVVSHCGCGCASIDFVDKPGTPLEILSDHRWEDPAGHLFGVFAFAKEGSLAGLEVWSIDGKATPTVLPDPSVLVPLDSHAA
jgi:hypothetical protein